MESEALSHLSGEGSGSGDSSSGLHAAALDLSGPVAMISSGGMASVRGCVVRMYAGP